MFDPFPIIRISAVPQEPAAPEPAQDGWGREEEDVSPTHRHPRENGEPVSPSLWAPAFAGVTEIELPIPNPASRPRAGERQRERHGPVPAFAEESLSPLPGEKPAPTFAGGESLPPLPGAKPVPTFAGGAGEFTPDRRLLFCDRLAASGNVRLACKAARISPQTAYKARRRDAAFALAWDAALALARDHAEAVLADHALNGVDEPVFYHGEEVARRRRYDGRLLLAHLGRLDRLCDRPEVEDAAARFDELLAMLGGHPPDPGMMERAPGAEDSHVPGLATPREAWVDYRGRWTELDEEAALLEEGLGEEQAFELAAEAGEAAREEAEAEWDAHHAKACAFVDAMGEETQAGAGDSRAAENFSPEQCQPCHPLPEPACVRPAAASQRAARRPRDCSLARPGPSRAGERGR
ncbi:MAG: hypothetical protein WCY92_08655, partial [Novosphingobium sp.]